MHIRDQVQLSHRALPWKLPVISSTQLETNYAWLHDVGSTSWDNAGIATQLNCDQLWMVVTAIP